MISDENLRQLKALVMECVTEAVTRLLDERGLIKTAALKNKGAAERMRRYRERQRNAKSNGKRNADHRGKRNALRNGECNAQAVEVLDFLNAETHSRFPAVPANIDIIAARLEEGYTPIQLRQIVVRKSRDWGSDPKMRAYLRPKTIFNKTNAANYAGELVVRHD